MADVISVSTAEEKDEIIKKAFSCLISNQDLFSVKKVLYELDQALIINQFKITEALQEAENLILKISSSIDAFFYKDINSCLNQISPNVSLYEYPFGSENGVSYENKNLRDQINKTYLSLREKYNLYCSEAELSSGSTVVVDSTDAEGLSVSVFNNAKKVMGVLTEILESNFTHNKSILEKIISENNTTIVRSIKLIDSVIKKLSSLKQKESDILFLQKVYLLCEVVLVEYFSCNSESVISYLSSMKDYDLVISDWNKFFDIL